MKSCASILVATFGVGNRRHPARIHKNPATFLGWATDNYEVDAGTHEILPRTMPPVPRLPRSHHEKTTGGRRKPPRPPLEKCQTCVQFTSLESNAYYQIKTDRGHSTRTKGIAEQQGKRKIRRNRQS